MYIFYIQKEINKLKDLLKTCKIFKKCLMLVYMLKSKLKVKV